MKRCTQIFALTLIMLTLIAICLCPITVHSEAIIADHTAARQFPYIPDQWIEAAKKLTIHYAHTSHGSQIVTGLFVLENMDSQFSFAYRQSSSSVALPPEENPPALRMYDGNPPETYINPDDYWESEEGIARTKAVVDTGLFNFSMWSWCGQMSWYSEDRVNNYLSILNTLESEYPSTRFIYMTGHTDGTQDNDNSTLRRNNQMVRDYVTANNKVLFDFADVESWDPDGNYYPNTTDACPWCEEWCEAHPDDCDFTCDCAHSHKFNCLLKAKAFWWMMARLAGWDGCIVDFDKDGDTDGFDLALWVREQKKDSCLSKLADGFGNQAF